MQKTINFDKLSEFLRDVINPASDHLAGLGINITEYQYRLANHQESGTTYQMHIFHLTFDPERPNDYVKYWFENELQDENLNPYIQINFSSVEGCATALVMI